MAYSTINNPTDFFNTILYTGNGSTNNVTGVGFEPDWVWIKNRTGTSYNHRLYDVVRGATKNLAANETDAEITSSTELTSFDSDGFSLGSAAPANGNTVTFASWNWLAGGSASSNTDGSITSSVSANTTAGFSIVSYTGTGANATVGHSLNSAPELIFFKNRENGTQEWDTYAEPIGATKFLQLNSTAAAISTNAALRFNSTAPTSSVFSVGTATTTNESADGIIAYCFHSVKGYSKIGSYKGNGNNDGVFVYTGFKPAIIIVKDTSAVNNWRLFDNKRPAFNQTDKLLFPSGTNNETVNVSGSGAIDITSNGFKCRSSAGGMNGSGSTFIYMAIAERSLVGTNNVPALAR